MQRRVIALLVFIMCSLMMFFGTWVTAQDTVRIFIDGTELTFDGDTPPMIVQGRTLVPFRKIFEALGMSVSWDEATQTAKGEKEGLVIELTIGSTIAKVNGQEKELDVPAQLIGSRTVVPLRFVSEESGAKVDWDGETSTVYITMPPPKPSYDYTSEILPVKDGRDAILTITLDDGFIESGKFYKEQFEKNDIKGSMMLIVDWAKKNPQAYEELISTGHIEIESHSMTHVVLNEETDDETRKREIVDSREMLLEMFPTQQVLCFAPSNNTSDPKSDELIKKTYYAMRKGVRGFNSLSPSEKDWYNLKTQGALSTVEEDEMHGWIDTAISQNRWLIEMWHSIEEYADGSYHPVLKAVAERHFEKIGQAQKEGKLWVATFGEATKYLRECQAALLVDNEEPDSRVIKLEDNLPDDVFDYPLTIKSYVPADWVSAKVVQGDTEQSVDVISEDGVSYIIYSAVPDRGMIRIEKTG